MIRDLQCFSGEQKKQIKEFQETTTDRLDIVEEQLQDVLTHFEEQMMVIQKLEKELLKVRLCSIRS